MRINKLFAATATGAVLVTSLVLAAPAANAALCGYPPVECPTGATNPPEEQPVGATPAARAQAGMTLPDQTAAAETPPTAPSAPPAVNAIGEAPKIPAVRGDVVKVRSDADAGTTYRVLVKRNDGPYNFIGTVTANSNGKITLPAVQFDRKGTYTFALQAGNGETLYIKVNVD